MFPFRMLSLPGYQVTACIYESLNSLIYRGTRQSDHMPVILKMLREDYPTPQELIRYRQEYAITQSLHLDGVIRTYGLEPYRNTLIMFLEDFGGDSLSLWMRNNQNSNNKIVSLQTFLSIAIQITESLGRIHAAGVIHKDINPSNIVYNAHTEQLKIIDFGISTQFNREIPTLQAVNLLEGTLGYISPEQTGRMNCAIDYRTDFYSLGVTFYELLTGQLPFDAKDPLELVHCHMAIMPIPIVELNPSVPRPLSDVVMKLLAKNADDRYQSAWGLQTDLYICQQQWARDTNITPFVLAQQDICDRFRIPKTLYGREQELERLLATFERVVDRNREKEEKKNQSEFLLVSGYSGIGKTSLVQELYKPITAKRGYFVSGKFDQFQRDRPYSALMSALKELVRQLLRDTEAELSQWREKFLGALGNNGQVIIDVISELELIIGKQPALAELEAQETQNRFNLVFQNFIRTFCTSGHPLVIFLDDLQWADAATLNWLKLSLVDAPIEFLLLIGAYRDNEVNPTHPLSLTLDQLQNEGVVVHQINLTPLTLEHISQFMAEALQSHTAQIQPVATLVWQKTRGNPFFVNEFLKTLYIEKLIGFDWNTRSWTWDLEQIKAKKFTDNVVDFMVHRVQLLPSTTQHILQLAACIGSEFDLQTLAIICEQSPLDIFINLTIAMQSELIVARSVLDAQLLIQNFQFGHDRIQQAAFSLIPVDDRPALHLKIGRLLLNKTSPHEQEEIIFTIVNHLNAGIALLTTQPERDELAQLNRIAGQKAKTATAYAAAVHYLNTGLILLPDTCWQDQYSLTLDFYLETAEVEYLNTNFERAETLSELALGQIQTTLDKIKFYILKIKLNLAKSEIKAALSCGLGALDLLGVPLIDSLPPELTQKSAIEPLANLPIMTDPYMLAAMDILILIYAPACFGEISLALPIVYTSVALSQQYGNAPSSSYTYAIYGIVAAWFLLDIDLADALGQLAWTVLDQLQAKAFKSKAWVAVLICITYKKHSIQDTIEPLREAITSALDVGDIEFAAHAANYYCDHLFFSGEKLETLSQTQANYIHFIGNLKQEHPLRLTEITGQVVANLLNQSEYRCQLTGDRLDEDVALAQCLQSNNLLQLFNIYFYKSFLSYLFGDYETAIEHAKLAIDHSGFLKANYVYTLLNLYHSLALLAHYPDLYDRLETEVDSENSEGLNLETLKQDCIEQVSKNQELMLLWVQHAPMNFKHKYELIEAEKARILGEALQAMDYYDRAITGAKIQGFIQEEALANELAAKFYLEQGRIKVAQVYMRDAHYAYLAWGAIAKANDLETRYPQLLIKTTSGTQRLSPDEQPFRPNIDSISDRTSSLDLMAIMQASQALSEEILLEKLLIKLMKTILESAGAQHGWLLLQHEGTWFVEASGTADNISVLQSIAVNIAVNDDSTDFLPKPLISYVMRTGDSVVLDNAISDSQLFQDAYIQQYQPKSVLCAPLIYQGNLKAIVYLENNLTIGAFTKERTKVIRLLCAQAAISLENARLYAEKETYACLLEQKVAERTTTLEQLNSELQRLASLDGLTQIANRRRFDEYLQQQWNLLLREQQPLALILCDVDYFKKYNDCYGHQRGDDCLKQVAQAISRAVKRPADLVARYGGEEFAVILPLTNASGATIVANTIQHEIQQLQLPHIQSGISKSVTMSLGIACIVPTADTSLDSLIATADAALYEAKRQGRNRWVSLPNPIKH